MNILLWILQIVLGLYFLAIGIMHFIIPPGLPPAMAWMYELTPTLHYISGIAEILGGLGLILPAVQEILHGFPNHEKTRYGQYDESQVRDHP